MEASKNALKDEEANSFIDSDHELDDHMNGHQRQQRLLVWLWNATLLVLASGWIIPLLQRHSIVVHKSTTAADTWGRPDNTPLPPEVFQTVKKTFFRDERYIGTTVEVHRNWDHIVAGHDALYIENPEAYGLPKGTHPPFDHPGKVGEGPPVFYVVTILHEMHCLNIIRYRYWEVKGKASPLHDYSDAAWDAHIDHCFEYLRQSISCGSAFQIEGASPLKVPGEKGKASTVTGWGTEHSCINFEALRAFQINQERRYNATWHE
ncbi:hypothetical protein CMQ_6720 [Grosmannia clavigera kw1407]|uniref:Tat pathway signal sequence n=1 Tax=Grosmannia clavigera (strain kw1407 / UAMH 11150) TaxID=655863 RepID=F0X6V7_GROCL|nr:uncharacterized protein CMQ_6720 [Grosmannia clavigera kw1407]EFX06399.1 hypothetical protein CMQ_6720 [Grosmannia clavigera kw1407]